MAIGLAKLGLGIQTTMTARTHDSQSQLQRYKLQPY